MNRIPTTFEKKNLLNNISNDLTKNDHMYILQNIVGFELCTETQTCYMFDLNDLSNETFWKLYEYVKMSIDVNSRSKVLFDSNNEHQSAMLNLENKMNNDFNKIKK